MTQDQLIALTYIFAAGLRIVRIRERWGAPLLRGPEWFFGVAVRPDFLNGAGAVMLRNYRWRLLLPWLIEIPILIGILLRAPHVYIIYMLLASALSTRLNYYAARNAAKRQARAFDTGGADESPSAIALSLQPRTLAAYTNPWLETIIVLAVSGSVVWFGWRYAFAQDWQALRRPMMYVVTGLYLQAGLLLLKRAIIRARSTAPADSADQYLAWRDSLRRLSTTICDHARLLLTTGPLVAEMQAGATRWAGSTLQAAALISLFGLSIVLALDEWRHRRRHLEIARRTKPVRFPVLPAIPDAASFVCFRPESPVLLLSGARGYTLNLASAPARTASLYVAGYAALWICLMR
jgi:hypothetical protein